MNSQVSQITSILSFHYLTYVATTFERFKEHSIACRCFRCHIDSFLTTYPGLPLGARVKDKATIDKVMTVERFEERHLDWKSKYLGGRLTLIWSVLSSIPNYFLFVFPLPYFCGHHVRAMQRNFLWGSFGSNFKYHLVRWNIAKQPVIQRGLGLRTCRSSMKLFLASGFGEFWMRKEIFGERWLPLHTVRRVLVSLLLLLRALII